MYLQCHSYYSLRYGTISEEELVDLAIAKGYSFAALTDINNSAAVLSFVKYCQKKNIPPIVGIDCRDRNSKGYVGIARNAQGFYNLNQFVSEIQASKKGYPKYAPDLDEVSFIYPFTQVQIENLQITLPNHYIGVSIKDLNRLRFSKLIENEERLVFLSPVSFRSKRDFNTHRLLRAIDNNTLLSKLAVEEQGDIDHQMLDINELKKAVNDLDFLLEQTAKLSKQCSFEYSFDPRLPSENQQLFGKNQEEDEWLLRRLCHEGIAYRYPNEKPKELHERLAKELQLICEKSFTTYFLINWDLTREARKRGFFYIGRGSGANSLVAYLLRITDVDPIELNLYFERFINKYRSSPPDFDIDFSWRERDQMIQYLFERYPNVCLLGAYVTFQKRAVIREVGKVFGLSKEEIDALVANTKPLGRNKESDELQRLVLHYAQFIEGLPNHFSIHAGGMLITEKPIHHYATTFFPPKGFRTIHLDMHIAEDARLHKFDILSQRGLSKIADALKLIDQNQNKHIDIHQIENFKNDTTINELLARGDCMGCFYIESPAMRMLLQKLKVSNYLSLVAASSIIRPGVSQSGMMNEYILRHQNPEKVHQRANPVLLNIMPETYGVMVYQEDVIKVAHYYGGLSLAEADVLRRGMSGKSRSKTEFDRIKVQFFENGNQKGYREEEVSEVWRQIESFAGYAFAKGHSASYAVESYQSLFLRAYYPLEYLTAVINNGGGFYGIEFYLKEAVRLGARVYTPCINKSHIQHTIVKEELYLGFIALKELEERSIIKIVEARTRGEFKSLFDFIDRVPIGNSQIELLIRTGAFSFTNENKHSLLWQALGLKNSKQRNFQPKLFASEQKGVSLTHLKESAIERTYELWELLGFPLSMTFELLKNPIQGVTADQLEHYDRKAVRILGYLVTVKNTRTKNGKIMQFATYLDINGAIFDTTSFPEVAQKYPVLSKGIYLIEGLVCTEFGFRSIEVKRKERCEYVTNTSF